MPAYIYGASVDCFVCVPYLQAMLINLGIILGHLLKQ